MIASVWLAGWVLFVTWRWWRQIRKVEKLSEVVAGAMAILDFASETGMASRSVIGLWRSEAEAALGFELPKLPANGIARPN